MIHFDSEADSQADGAQRLDRGRRRFVAASAATALGSLLTAAMKPAHAAGVQPYPSRPIQFVVPFASGGGTDMVARPLVYGMEKQLGQSIVVINKPGAAGMIGTSFVARAAPDGYTVALGSTGTHTVNQWLYNNLTYDPIRGFDPVSMICQYVNVLVVRPDFPAKDFREFIALIKAHPKKYFYGITQNGSSAQLAMELLKSTAGLDVPGIPYKGAAQAVNDFLGGQYPILMDVVVNQMQFIRDGKVRPLAVTSRQRSKALPDVPTIGELGYPGFEAVGWNGVFVPAGTPKAIVEKLNASVRFALTTEAMQRLASNGLELTASSPQELGAFVVSESQKWHKVIEMAHIKAS